MPELVLMELWLIRRIGYMYLNGGMRDSIRETTAAGAGWMSPKGQFTLVWIVARQMTEDDPEVLHCIRV